MDRTYDLAAASHLNIVGLPEPLVAGSGTLSVVTVAESLQVTATAVEVLGKKTKPRVAWSVTLLLGGNGRALSGAVTVGTQTWDVVANTGVFATALERKAASIATTRAFTVNQGDSSTNTPVTVHLDGVA